MTPTRQINISSSATSIHSGVSQSSKSAAEPAASSWTCFDSGIDHVFSVVGALIHQGRSLTAVLNTLCTLFDSAAPAYHCNVILLHSSGSNPRPMNSDPRSASQLGAAPVWTSPILSLTGEVLGIFAIFKRQAAGHALLQQTLIQQFVHVASVVIERTRSNEALNRTQLLLTQAQRLSLTGGFAWRVHSGDMTWSQEVYQILDIDPSTAPTLERIAGLVHPEDVSLFNKMVSTAKNNPEDLEFEHRLAMSDRTIRFVRIVAHAIRDDDGEIEYVGTVQDVTQRRLSEEALTKARSDLARMARLTSLGAMTASIAHEVNQPLTGIITNASTCLRMLAMDTPDIEGARDTARRALRDGQRASEVISRLRAMFSKRDTAAELVDLRSAIREVLALTRGEFKVAGVLVRTDLDNVPPITGDRIQLQQVILNLLLNAAEAMSNVDDRARQIVIRTSLQVEAKTPKCVLVSVRDSGEGVAAADTQKLFEAFYTTKSGGIGIGLSVSRCIIEGHQGRLWAERNDGPGATFSFSLPCTTSKAAIPQNSNTSGISVGETESFQTSL